jgi:hypothetical protein
MAHEPITAGRFPVWFLQTVVAGVYRYPTVEELPGLVQPVGEETEADARMRVLDRFGDAAAETDRRAAATLTAAGFALTINGLLLDTGPVAEPVVFGLAFPALLAFLACFLCFMYWVDRAPGPEASALILEDARASCILKQFYTVVAELMVFVALLAYAVALGVLALG